MRDWFDSLAPRERMFVATGAVLVALVLLYGFLWVPFDKSHQQLASDVENWQQSLAELKPLTAVLAAQPAGGGNTARPASNQTPVVIVDQTARSRGLDRSLKRSQPTTSSGIRVEFEDVAFDDLVLWLGDLSSQYGLIVQQGSFARSQAGPGRVNSTLTLERAL
jgi:general secretion pathway protein M